jgi:hypothetical protein
MELEAPRFWLRTAETKVNEVGTTPSDASKKFVWSHYRFMFNIMEMPWDWPAIVSNLEAEAFCRWKGEKLNKNVRLLSHEEQLRMCELGKPSKNSSSAAMAMTDAVPSTKSANINLALFGAPSAVDSELTKSDVSSQTTTKCEEKPIYDLTGNVWRHSCSVLTVMPVFKPHFAYDDFTLPTIDGFHSYILGGSFISLGNCANVAARYGFRRHFYQFAGIRYVCPSEKQMDNYHKDVPKVFEAKPLGKFITEHFGSYWKSAPPQATSNALARTMSQDSPQARLASSYQSLVVSDNADARSTTSPEPSSECGGSSVPEGVKGYFAPSSRVSDKDATPSGRRSSAGLARVEEETDLELEAAEDMTKRGRSGDAARSLATFGDAAIDKLRAEYLNNPSLTPVRNWPVVLGRRAADVVATALSERVLNTGSEDRVIKVLVAYGSVGRGTLELLAELACVK